MNELVKPSSSIVHKRSLSTKPSKSMPVYTDRVATPSADAPSANLEELFKEELNQLKERVTREAYDSGISIAREELDKKLSDEKQKLETGYREKISQLEDTIATLESVIDNAKEQHTISRASSELDVISLTMECLYRLAGKKEIYNAIVENTFEEIEKNSDSSLPVRVRVSSEDAKIIEKLPMVKEQKVKLVIDSHLSPGSFYMETGFSTVDLGIITKLDQLREILINTYKEAVTDNA